MWVDLEDSGLILYELALIHWTITNIVVLDVCMLSGY